MFSHLHADHCLDIFSPLLLASLQHEEAYASLPLSCRPESQTFSQAWEVLRVDPQRLLDGDLQSQLSTILNAGLPVEA